MKAKYPLLEIHVDRIKENAKVVVDMCKARNIHVAGVFKGTNGQLEVARVMEEAGCSEIASSRIEQLRALKLKSPDTKTLLIRLPMISELEDVVSYADVSLNSELDTIRAIHLVSKELGKRHKIILMMDLGDLREGYFEKNEILEVIKVIENELPSVEFAGIGTNLGCFGSIKPTVENMEILAQMAKEVETMIGRKLEYVSGGATSSLPLVLNQTMPEGINHLRIGEGILLNLDLPMYWDVHIPNLNQETFLLKAQVIEIKDKPSFPVGEIFIDAFGNRPEYEDIGIRKRALLAIGKQDFVMHDKLIPVDSSVTVIGSSSDHLIMDITDASESYEIGDVMAFKVFYGPMLHICTNCNIKKIPIG